MLLGCIGDDFTGSSDLANTLAKQGMRTVQYTGVPNVAAKGDVEVGVVALKSRSIDVAQAIRQSLDALNWLKAQGCKQFFFKYCSTFDSTKVGNIGPVAEALADALDAGIVVFCPAFPGAGRTIYQGHLFVNDQLLNESGMESHPLTPMTDSDIARWLQHQSSSSVGKVTSTDVLAGVDAVDSALAREQSMGNRFVVVDAIRDEDLMTIGRAVEKLPLITGGSGVAMGLPENFRKRNLISQTKVPWTGQSGRCVILSGSCSIATRAQVDLYSQAHPSLEVSPGNIMNKITTAWDVAKWVLDQTGIPLVYTSTDPESVKQVQKEFGKESSASAVETLFAETAKLLVDGGVSSLVVAGGETSGAIVEGLGITTMEVGPEIDPGVPAMRARDDLVIALKSGNFGTEDFFAKAVKVLSTDLIDPPS
ncbi:MAG: hypothetical protein GKR95_15775 [Gammaproteobacteria bacterium]|nr:hypothetical protein [Gammaproteobacteria bacterium]